MCPIRPSSVACQDHWTSKWFLGVGITLGLLNSEFFFFLFFFPPVVQIFFPESADFIGQLCRVGSLTPQGVGSKFNFPLEGHDVSFRKSHCRPRNFPIAIFVDHKSNSLYSALFGTLQGEFR